MNDKLRKKRKSSTRKTIETKLQIEQLEPRLALTVVINEFLTDNSAGIRDTATHRHDWIELKNTGVVAENLAGWYLSDSATDLTKFQIPNAGPLTVLDPGELLLVYASGNNGEVGVVGGELHTDFQLSQEPGYLALVQSNGTTIEHEFNLYPQQTSDVSFGSGIDTATTATDTLITTGSAAKYRVFTGLNASVDDYWRDIDYNDTAWNSTTTGVGWNTDGGSEYAGLIPTPISAFSSPDVSAYVRVPFTVTNKAELVSMNLELIADNAYIVFLNGREVQRARLATDFKIGFDWDLNSRQNLPDSANATPDIIDLTDWLDTIEEGENVLAIYGANHTSQQGDFLIHPHLTVERASGSLAPNRFMVTPSPGLENGAGYEGLIEDTLFTADRGFYTASFPLGISTTTPGATIRYTTDGTRPTLTHGSTYSSAITISPSLSDTDSGVVTIRAAAFKSGYFPSNVDTQSYIFLDNVLTDQDGTGLPDFANWGHAGPDWDVDASAVGAGLTDALQAIPTMSLVMDWEELFGNSGGGDDDHGIYTQTTGWRDKSDERQGSLEYFTANGSEEFQIDAKIEIQGHSSTLRWRQDKLSFQVKFKQPYDTRLDSDTLFVNSAVDGTGAATRFDTLILDAGHNFTFTTNNNDQNSYPRYINDQVVADLINSAGGDSPHGRFVHLYINGMYWGIYDAHERPDSRFASEYYGGAADDYFVVKASDGFNQSHGGTHPEYLYVDGGLAAEAAYQNLLNQAADNMANLAQYQAVADILDVDAFIDYMIVHYYAGNWDWGQDNWYASFNNIDPNGKWRFHAWDQEHAFNTSDSPDGHDQNSDYTDKNDTSGPTGLHNDLMGSPEYLLRFSDRVQELMRNGGIITPSQAQAVWQTRIDELSDAINGETARWGDNRQNHNTQVWRDSVQDAIDSWFPTRTSTTIADFQGRGWLVAQAAPVFNQYGGDVASGFDVAITNPSSGTLYFTTDGSDPRLVGGAVNTGSVTSGAGPLLVDISSTTRIRARVLNGGNWSAEVDKTFTVGDLNPAALRIVELHYNPSNGDQYEFIELLNTGATALSLDGVQIADFASTPYGFQSGQSLAGGARIIVARNPSDFANYYGGAINLATGAGFEPGNLSNGGELISLLGPSGNLLQRFTYQDAGGWPTASDGTGPSLEYLGPLTGSEDPLAVSPADPFDNPTNWRASFTSGGSPGTDGEPVLADSADFDGDGDVDGGDFLTWQRGYGSTNAARVNGNADNDADVDGDDLGVWHMQFGTVSAIATPFSHTNAEVTARNQAAIDAVLTLSLTREPEDNNAADLAIVSLAVEEIPHQAGFAHEDSAWTAFGANGTDFVAITPTNADEVPIEWLADELLESFFG